MPSNDMDIVEKVARAICKEWFLGSERTWQNFLPAARAAIEAMRSPTETMAIAGRKHSLRPAQTWAVMIDGALKEDADADAN